MRHRKEKKNNRSQNPPAPQRKQPPTNLPHTDQPRNKATWKNLLPKIETWRWGLMDLLYPVCCFICEAETSEKELFGKKTWSPLCEDCLRKIPDLCHVETCLRCGARLKNRPAVPSGCPRCETIVYHFDQVVAMGEYRQLLRTLILQMKKSGGPKISRFLARRFYQLAAPQLHHLQAEVVIPVPMYWTRRLRRGTNSAILLAEGLAAGLKLPLLKNGLVRNRNTEMQYTLLPNSRRKNVKGAFECRAERSVRNKKVLLVDDILTTGATCDEAAKVLKNAGAVEVSVAVLGRSLLDQ